MSVINVKRTHKIPLQELKSKINTIVQQLSSKLDFYSEWESDSLLRFRRKGANGLIKVNDDDFEITLKLGIAFRMMKSAIENEITSIVDKHI